MPLFRFWDWRRFSFGKIIRRKKLHALGVRKIAVLPFRASTKDDEINALSNGITDSLVTLLSRIEKLSVLPSALVSGYKSSEQSPLEFGSKIGADAVLDGMVRKTANKSLSMFSFSA